MRSIQFCGVSKVYRGSTFVAASRPESAAAIESASTKSRGIRAVDKLDLEVRSGELLVVMGPSGSGKTTVLRLIAGLEEPSEGRVLIDGRDQRGVPARQRNIAMVFQGLGLYGHLTARQNLEFGLRKPGTGSVLSRWFGTTKRNDEVDQAVEREAQRLGIAALLEKRPGELSGGEQQRVAIGRALIRQPDVFLLDEPLASLDGPTRWTLRRELKELQQRLGVTTIYVTHDQGEALALGDRIAVLHQGKLQQIGSPQEVYRRPANRLVASLFGGLGMNLIAGRVTPGRSNGEWVRGDWRLALAGIDGKSIENSVVLGIRPDDVLAQQASAAASGWQGVVKGVEYQGESTYVHVTGMETDKEGGQPPTMTAKVMGAVPVIGETVRLQVSEGDVCWFDGNSGVSLGVKPADGAQNTN